MNKKGFTLIELLAVIVILAVLMAIAIPKVTQYITKSRKDSLVTTSKDFINAVRNDATSEMFDFPIGVDDVTIISLDLIKLEKGGKKSSFNGGKRFWKKKGGGGTASPDTRKRQVLGSL